MAEHKEVLLNKKDTAFLMGVSVTAFAKWNLAPVGTKGSQVFYDLKHVIAYRLDKEKEKKTNLTEERIRLIKAQAEKAEFELKVLKQSFVPVEEVKNDAFNLGRYLRDALSAVNVRIVSGLSSAKDKKKFEKLMRKEHDDILKKLTDANKYK